MDDLFVAERVLDQKLDFQNPVRMIHKKTSSSVVTRWWLVKAFLSITRQHVWIDFQFIDKFWKLK